MNKYKKLNELGIGISPEVASFQIVRTKYGSKPRVTLNDSIMLFSQHFTHVIISIP
jgi:hypothetical protein